MYNRNYYLENREREIEKVIRYQKRQREKNPKYRITNNTRALFSKVLKHQKTSRTLENRLGYDVSELKEHLLKTIPEGFTWNDFLEGKIILDHIIPVSSFNYTNYEDEEYIKCWNYNNLRLLEPEKNILKGDKLDKSLVKEYEIENLLPA